MDNAPSGHDRYLLREGHVLGFVLGSVLTTWHPFAAAAWLLFALVMWALSWRNADDR